MKKRIIFETFCATVVLLLVAGFPRRAQLRPQGQAQVQCSNENKNQYYGDFQNNYKGGNRDKAFEAAMKYLACPADASDQEDALASLNFAVGRMLSLKNSHSEAIPYLLKAATYDSAIKKSPETYYYLADAYEQGPYEKLAAVYRAKFEGNAETDESKKALENLYPIVDRIIDAYARAVAFAGVRPRKTARRGSLRVGIGSPTEWMDDLIAWYEFRHKGSDVGLDKLIANIISQIVHSHSW